MPHKDTKMLQELVDKYAKLYMQMACNKGVPYDDAEDIVLDSMWSFYNSEYYGNLDENETKYMIARIVKNKCIDYYRKNKHNTEMVIDDGEETLLRLGSSSSKEPENQLIEKENYRRIRSTMENMKPVLRDTAIMYFLEDRSFSEISKALDVSESVCRKRIQRAREYLREELRDLWKHG